jgi:hypothetical protein
MTSPLVIAHPNRLNPDPRYATVLFSGGAWEPDLPLANLALESLSDVARSVDTALSSTRFWVDLGRLRDISVVAIPWFRGYQDGDEVPPPKSMKVRLRAFDAKDESLPVITGSDTGWTGLCPVTYPAGTLPAWHPSFVDGKMTDEEWSEIHGSGAGGMPFWTLYSTPIIARHWLVEIDVGASGYDAIDIPRAVFAPGHQYSINFGYGAGLSWEDPTIMESSMGGAEFFEVLEGRMVFRFGIDYLLEDEALTQVRDMQVNRGTSGQLFVILHPYDTVHRHRRAMLCRMRTLSPIEYAVFGRDKVTFELSQIIA